MTDTDKKDRTDNPSRANMPAGRAEGDNVNEDGSPVVAPAFHWPDATAGDPGAFNASGPVAADDEEGRRRG